MDSALGVTPSGEYLCWRTRARKVVESKAFNVSVTVVILLNAITLGLETWPVAVAAAGPLLYFLDRTALIVFSLEIGLKLWVYRRRFFAAGWNNFDLIIVGLAWIPAAGPISVLRSLRILRALRLMSLVPQMRTVVSALFSALPGMASIIAVLMLVFYVAAVMATKLFGAAFPEWFGSVGASMYSLFQIMTLESWSMGIVRPMMEVYPYAWAFFVPFVIVTSFAVLNLFIGLIVNSLQNVQSEERVTAQATAARATSEREQLLEQVGVLQNDIRRLRERLEQQLR